MFMTAIVDVIFISRRVGLCVEENRT